MIFIKKFYQIEVSLQKCKKNKAGRIKLKIFAVVAPRKENIY
jgi:hypothetical protein